MSSAKWRSYCLSLNVLNFYHISQGQLYICVFDVVIKTLFQEISVESFFLRF